MIRRLFISYLSFLVLQLRPILVTSVAIDNGVEGEPVITCGANELSFSVATRRQFEGKIFVKGAYGKSECTSNGTVHEGSEGGLGNTIGSRGTTSSRTTTNAARFTNSDQCPPCPVCSPSGLGANNEHLRALRQPDQGRVRNSAQLIVHIGTCNMKRERSLNPNGVTLSLTVVVSFHPQFITKVDKAYQLRCFYMETEKTVTSIVDVSMPQTTELVAQASMPVCTYSIRRGTPNGTEIQYAKVGDTVFHRWQCATATGGGMFGMLIHSCYVDDGKGQRVQVINQTGCSLDTYVIGDLTYENSLYAYVEAHVFKFADRAVLDFQCAINLCVKEGDGCKGITPPVCGGRRKIKRDAAYSNSTSDDELDRNGDLRNADWDLRAQRLTVVDLDDNIRSEDLAHFEELAESASKLRSSTSSESDHPDDDRFEYVIERSPSKSTFCLSVAAFGVLVSTCTFVMTVSAAVLATLYFLRHQKHHQ